jgi:hypothetical protein
LSEKVFEKCPQCGRQIYANRPSCLYCGWRRPISTEQKRELQKELIGKMGAPGWETKPAAEPGSAAAPSVPPAAAARREQLSPVCPKCLKPMKPGAKFCTSCGAGMDEPPARAAIGDPGPRAVRRAAERNDVSAQAAPQPPAGAGGKRQNFRFFSSGERSASVSNIINPPNGLWLAGIVLFIIAARLPFGFLPPMKTGALTSSPQPAPFPSVLLIPYAAIFIFMILSMIGAGLPGGLNGKYFFPAFSGAASVYLIAPAILSFRKEYFALMLIFFVIYLIALRIMLRKPGSVLNRLRDYEALVIQTAVFILIISFFLKPELLSAAGLGFTGNKGLYTHLAAVICIIAGSYLKIDKTTQNRETGVR